MKKRMASESDEPVRLFGRFTFGDLVRLGLPAVAVLWSVDLAESIRISTVVLLGLGGLTGLVWYGWRPYGEPVEINLYHLIRWAVLRVLK